MAILAAAVFDLIDRIAAATTVQGVWDAYLGAAAEVRLPFAAASFYPPDTTAMPIVMADAMPAGYMRDYLGQGLLEGDLLTQRTRSATVSFKWRITDWDGATLTPIQQRWRDHNLRHGIEGGVIVLDFRRGENMVMVVCGPDGVLNTHDRLVLYFAGQEAMLRLREMLMPEYAPLSRRERECLQWVCAGKTDREIGTILSLSEKTVNVYIDRAKIKFNVVSRTQAAVLAARAGMIAA
jgi:DNA-binding CsgD family transcriptional regulator